MTPRLLYVDVKWPTPSTDAASQRTTQLLGALVELGFAVDFGAMYPPDAFPGEQAPVELPPLGGGRLIEAAGEQPMLDYARQHAADYRVAVLAWTRVAAQLLPVLRMANPRLFICFDTNDVNHVREYRHARVSGNANILRRALAMKAAELSAVAAADCTVAISETDAAVLAAGVPGSRVSVVTLAAPERTSTPPGAVGRRGALFMGNYEAMPNVDAARHLARDVMPPLREARPTFELTLAGAGRRELVAELAGDGIEVIGYAADMASLMDRRRLFACPLRIGSGIKGKVLSALAYGLPVVATPIAVEGMDLVDGEHCLIAEGAPALAAACARLDEDDALWQRLQAGGLAVVAQRFSLDVVRHQVAALFRPLLAGADKLAT